jgi:hypothetical protein
LLAMFQLNREKMCCELLGCEVWWWRTNSKKSALSILRHLISRTFWKCTLE